MASERISKPLVSLCLVLLFIVLPINAEESFSKHLWKKYENLANKTLQLPFIVNLIDNTLPNETFGYYLYQDVDFLRGYSESCRIAAQYATDEEVTNELIKKGGKEDIYVSDLISYFEDLNLVYTPCKYRKNVAAYSYIEFMINAAESEETVYLFTALTPCSRLYYYLGKTINDTLTPEQLKANKYRKWIEDNAAAQGSAEKMDYFIDKLSEGLPQEKLDKIDELYKQGLQHEIHFFTAAAKPPPLHVQNKVVGPPRKYRKGMNYLQQIKRVIETY